MSRVLHHVAIGSPDVERLARFYIDVLNVREHSRHSDGNGNLRSIWLDVGSAVLMIERTSQRPRRVEGIGAGPFLLAFAIEPSERAALELALAEAGAPIQDRTRHTSYTRDPDGNRIAISHYPTLK